MIVLPAMVLVFIGAMWLIFAPSSDLSLIHIYMFYVAYERIYAKPGNMTAGTDGKTVSGMSIEPVSYTHLDVYKRQAIACHARSHGLCA